MFEQIVKSLRNRTFLKQINKICSVRPWIFIVVPALFSYGCRTSYGVTAQPSAGTRVEKTAPSEKFEKRIVPYRSRVNEQLSEEVVRSDRPLEKGLPESELSNLIADAVFSEANKWATAGNFNRPDFCLLNSGGIRTALPAGMLNLGQIYEVMPFENEIVVLKLTPQRVRELVDYVAQKGGAPVAGIRMKLNENRAEQVEIGGKPYAFDRDLWVATSDFLAYGGDDMLFFSKPLEYRETKEKVRDAITLYFKSFKAAGQSLPVATDGRISR